MEKICVLNALSSLCVIGDRLARFFFYMQRQSCIRAAPYRARMLYAYRTNTSMHLQSTQLYIIHKYARTFK